MSTRSQIGFYNKKEDSNKKFEALIYRHSDGYPSAVLPDIIPFLKWWKTVRGISDLEYVSARLLQYLCNEYDKASKAFEKEFGKTLNKNDDYTGTLGHGICKGFHGDIEYFYKVYENGVQVFSCGFDETPDNYKLLVTIDLDKEVDIKRIIKLCEEGEADMAGETTK